MSKEYYFISDLHLGYEDIDEEYPSKKELITFLNSLKNKNKNTELIIVGDMFGLWEAENKITDLNKKPISVSKKTLLNKIGFKKQKLINILDIIINKNIEIFNQFKITGKNIKITLIAGNHDHEIVCKKEYSKILKKYNIKLETSEYILRYIENKKIWIEHGHQCDKMNKIDDFGNSKVKPLSFFISRELSSKLDERKDMKVHKWLKDLNSVEPRELVLNWIFSNYFYRELNPFLRYFALPFLLLLSFSFIVLIAVGLKFLGLIDITFLTNFVAKNTGIFRNVLEFIILVDMFIIVVMLLLIVPIILIIKDIKKSMKKYEFSTENLHAVKKEIYLNRAKQIFIGEKNVSLYVFGHTHRSFIIKEKNRLIINTGTWIKKLKQIKPLKLFILPSVYYPFYRLSVMKVYSKNKKIFAEHIEIPKKIKLDLTPLQRVVLFTRRKTKKKDLKTQSIDL